MQVTLEVPQDLAQRIAEDAEGLSRAGVLRAASLEGFIELPAVLTRLAATNFRISKELLDQLIADDRRRTERR